MSAVRIEQADVDLFREPDARQAINGLRQRLLPKLKTLRSAALSVAERRVAVDPRALAFVERPANRPDARQVAFYKEAYAGVSWPRSRNPLAVRAADAKPRYFPPTYLYFGLYPDDHLRVQLLWYRYNVEPSFRRDLRALVARQGSQLLEILSERGVRASDGTDDRLEASLDRPGCTWAAKPLAVPIDEGKAAWAEAVDSFILLLPLAQAAWRLAVGEVPNLAADCQALGRGLSAESPSKQDSLGSVFPEEVDYSEVHLEGAVHRVLVNAYERNPDARRRCIQHHGTDCCICGFSFGAVYGGLAEGLIHVHHLRPLSELGGEYQVDPIADLRPVCPNCHAVIHLGGVTRSVDEVKRLLDRRQSDESHAAADRGGAHVSTHPHDIPR